ncbi:hypothetical protein BKA70DRAFT_1252146 [Coprinopsis sp. MPI-PUGE-AT-0042]|nr:hypothetical protein BKA70DRAFT_1252146 [Coprinopsis sp. MPI-PUGE-AT-0042]
MKFLLCIAFLLGLQTIRATAQEVPVWGQCGGIGFEGSTICTSGSRCEILSEWCHQCRPGGPVTTPPVPTITTPPVVTPTITLPVLGTTACPTCVCSTVPPTPITTRSCPTYSCGPPSCSLTTIGTTCPTCVCTKANFAPAGEATITHL